MSEEELIKVLKEMDKKRVEELELNSRKLFDAIMKIADERDRLLEENQQLKADYGNKAQVERDLLLEENRQLKEEIKKYQEELSKADSITQSCIFNGAKESAISYRECLNELDKYKSLYENEKEHTDTLKRIIKKIEEYIKNIDEEEFINTEHYVEILDLLKEIK